MLIRDLHPDPNLEPVPHLQAWIAGRLDPPILAHTYTLRTIRQHRRRYERARPEHLRAALSTEWQHLTRLAERTGMSRTTAQKILARWTAAGVVERTTMPHGGVGRPHVWWRLVP